MRKQKYVRLPKRFETLKASQKESRLRQRCLAKSSLKRCRKLGALLDSCGGDDGPCGSGACPVCFRAYRKNMITKALKLHDKHPELKVVTLIFYEDAISSKDFMRWDVSKLLNKLRRQLGRIGVRGPIVGSFDIDYHDDIKRWLPHFHLLIPNDEGELKALRRYMNKGKNMLREGVKNRPMLLQKIKDPSKQISYLFKSYWSHIDHYLKDGARGTKKKRLKQRQFAISLVKLDQLGLKGGLFLYGLRESKGKLRMIEQCHRQKG